MSQFALNPKSSIYDLYLQAFDKTQGSHVMVYNAEHYGNLRWSDISEFVSNRSNMALSMMKRY